MTELIGYEFDSFFADTVRCTLSLNGKPIPLRPTPFRLLVVFLENCGRELSKEQLFKEVWVNTVVTDANLDVGLTAVRKALGESAREPHYIIKGRDSYRFVATAREIRDSSTELLKNKSHALSAQSAGTISASHSERPSTSDSAFALPGQWHIIVSTGLYALLFPIALLLEVSFKWNLFGNTALKLMLPVFVWMIGASIFGLKVDQRLSARSKTGGLLASVICFLAAAGILLAALSFFLPAIPITESTLQTYPAQAAYLKDIAYFLILAFFFLLLPFHFIMTAQRQIALGHGQEILGLLTGNKLALAPKGIVYPRFRVLALLLLGFAAISLALTAHLLDHLSYSPYMNLFIQLVYARGLVFFALGIECLVWYYGALEELKRQGRVSGS